jgi:hypothetical protein
MGLASTRPRRSDGSLKKHDGVFETVSAPRYVMTEADFEVLNEHLREVRPIFDDFCSQQGFVYVDRKSLGRYPRIRIERPGTTKIWFDLWIEVKRDERAVVHFRRDLPYELSAGMYADVQGGSKYGTRFQKAIQCFSGKPFEEVKVILKRELKEHLPILEEWTAEDLKDNGKKIQLGS